MKVTINWIKEFLETDHLDARKVEDLLTMSGTEVKRIEDLGSRFEKMVVGQILDFEQHPNADKLSVCRVDVGKEVLNIVCGARNFKLKDKVAVALEGAKTSQGMKISRSKLRGVLSEGMMCSEAELGLAETSEGIMILGEECKEGTGLAAALGLDDVVFELEITPNRPDCLSIIGIARELSALLGIPFKLPEYDYGKKINSDKNFGIDIRDYHLCPRYSAMIFPDIPLLESPHWLKNRLILCDYRPIDLIVDLTNYVMHETGQPLHAFDKDLLYSSKIIVRPARAGEKIRGIDDNIRDLAEGMLLICDEKKPVAIAGIMGGKDTEITPATKNVLLESANFFGPSIMRTSGTLGLRSEASNRFEKKIDPELTLFAISRFEELLISVGYSNVKTGIYDNYQEKKRTREIMLDPDRASEVLGKKINAVSISKILDCLGIKNQVVEKEAAKIKATIPSFRFEDLEREIDLIEEIARIYGYGNFESRPPMALMHKGKYSAYQKSLKNIRQHLCDTGLNEVINYTFISWDWIKKTRLDQDDNYKNAVKILNPINEDFAFLRTSPLAHMVKNTLNNFNHGIKDVSIFEISKVFESGGVNKPPMEKTVLGVLLSGRSTLKSWDSGEEYFNFFDLKKILEYIFNQDYKESSLELKSVEYPFFHPVISADIFINSQKTGVAGKIHPAITDDLDISQDIFYFELDLDKFIDNSSYSRDFKAIPAFPSVEIDLALVVGEEANNRDIEKEIRKSGTAVLKELRLFDIYRGKQAGEGKKSMAYSLSFQDEGHTLKDTEVQIIRNRILENLAKKFGAKLRE